jgi:histidinol-phosphatase (PHP family)
MTRPDRFESFARRDLHVHTPYCNHATGPMEAYVRAALDQELEELGFLAHVEIGVERSQHTWLSPGQLDTYWHEGQELRRRYAGRIQISLGIEVGVNPAEMAALAETIASRPWDRVGLAYHYLTPRKRSRQVNVCSRRDVQRNHGVDRDVVALNQRYYQVLGNAIEQLRPTMVCHLDVMRRNLADVSRHPAVEPLIRRALEAMQACGAVLEVNTSGYVHRPHGLEHPYPAPWILAAALEMGLELAFSSDSHDPSEVARHFDRAVQDCRHAARAAAEGDMQIL